VGDASIVVGVPLRDKVALVPADSEHGFGNPANSVAAGESVGHAHLVQAVHGDEAIWTSQWLVVDKSATRKQHRCKKQYWKWDFHAEARSITERSGSGVPGQGRRIAN